MKKITSYILVIASLMACIYFIAPIVAEKESARKDAVMKNHCSKIGYAINRHYGKEVCPPTPQG